MKSFLLISLLFVACFFYMCSDMDTEVGDSDYVIVGVKNEQNIIASFNANTGEISELGQIPGYFDITLSTPTSFDWINHLFLR